MMKALIIDDDDSLRQLTVLNIENSYPNVTIMEASSAQKAIEILNQENNISFIISDYNMPGGNGNLIYNHLLTLNPKHPPYILYSAADKSQIIHYEQLKDDHNALFLQKPIEFQKFTDKILAFLSDKIEIPTANMVDKTEEYLKVRISYFWRFNQTLCDIYLQLGTQKYVKIIHKNDHYDKNLIDKYVKKDQKFLFITKREANKFTGQLANTPFLSYLKPPSDPLNLNQAEERIKITTAIVHDLVLAIGISQNSITMTEAMIDHIEQIMETLSVGDLFKNIKHNSDYIYDHSYVLACMCTEVLKCLEWHNKENIQNLCYASFFHDISQVNPELSMVNSLEEAEMKGYTKDEIERFANHPNTSARYFLECPNLDRQIAQIIIEHHENPQGTGFPKGLKAHKIGRMSAIFIIAHQLVKELYEHQFDPEFIASLVAQIKINYQIGNFKEVFTAFEKIFAKV